MRIIITDIYLRKTFDVTNIIKRNYHRDQLVFCAENKSFWERIKVRLLYGAKKVYLLRNTTENFTKDLQHIAEAFKDEKLVYIPIEEDTTLFFYEYLNEFGSGNFSFSLPEFSVYGLSRNKELLNMFCGDNGINAPKYISETLFNSRDFKLPIIVKPKIGSGAKGIQYITNEASLEELKSQNLSFEDYFIQEKLPDSKNVVGGFFLCDKGELVSYYSHKRIRTYPESGGVTVFSKSGNNAKIKHLGAKLLKKLRWHGIAMIEFLLDPRTNEYKVIEINPRLWGSIMLSEFNGSKIISNYVSLQTGRALHKNKEPDDNTFIRWIFPYDVIYWAKNKFRPLNYFAKKPDTCYINLTYTTSWRALFFIFILVFNLSNLKKLLSRG